MGFKDKQFFYATAALIGTMVGVGIFGIPFAFAKAGFGIGFLFLIGLGLATLLLDLMYGEVVLRTQAQHQLVGYTELYLGRIFKKIMFFALAFSAYAALLAYIIVSGEFFRNVFFFLNYTPDTYSYVFFAVFSLLVLIGLKRISWIEMLLTGLFISVIILIFVFGFSKIDFNNLKTISTYYWFLPYGIVLFAFAGLAAIPIQKEILEGKETLLRKSIITAVFLVGILYAIYALTVVGISGESTTPDSIRGLYEFLGDKIIFLGSFLGALAIGTSYLLLGSALLEIFQYDYKINRFLSWILVSAVPIILFAGGVRTLIDIIGLSGAVALGLEMAILIAVYIKAKSKGDRIPEYSLTIPKPVLYLLFLVFLLGMAYALIK